MAGCCFGSPTDIWWGITFSDPAAMQLSGTPLGIPLHPTQVLQSLNNFLLFGILYFLHGRKPFSGIVTGIFFVYTGITRLLIEFLRGDPRGAFLGMSTSQWIGIGFMLFGSAVLLYGYHKRKSGGMFTRELEWQFELDDPEAAYVRLLEKRYGQDYEIRYEGTEEIDDTYVDTSGWAIHRAGFALRFRNTGDRVVAKVTRSGSGKDSGRLSGRVVKILSRAHTDAVGM